jgi:hypothetical protein
MNTKPRYEMVSSRLAGSRAHCEQLEQLLAAPESYWKAQTPVGMKPVDAFELSPDGTTLSKLVLAGQVTPREIETLLVLMAARMPGLSLELRIEGSETDLVGLRLWLGKLEAGHRSADGATAWAPVPHHSSLIGSK